jgi:VWFA-related protein
MRAPFMWFFLRCVLLIAYSGRMPAQNAPVTQQAPQTPPTLNARADLVVVDVVVTDARQNPVHGLKASDFTLLEDKVPQQIGSFEEHTASHIAKPPPMPALPPATFTNYTPAPASGPMNVLLLDAPNTPTNAQSYVRKQLLEYLKQTPPGTRIAIFGLTRHMVMLQGFTSDVDLLRAAVFGKGKAHASDLLDDPRDTITDFMTSTTRNDPVATQMIANVKQFESEQTSYELQMRQLYTLTAMNQLARYVGSIPGRKNLIWFSGSFPLNILPDGELTDPFSVVPHAQDDYRETTNLLARSQVAVYPIDARGVVSSPVHAVSSPQKNYARNPHAFAHDEAQFEQELFSEHGTMSQMAEDTGGRAFMDTDGFTAAVAQAIDSGSNYYTLTYAPTDKDWNGHYRKIDVAVAQPGIKLAYRRGYYADDPQARPNPGAESVAATSPDSETAMSLALMRGAPMPAEILLKERILPARAATEDNLAEGNELNPAVKSAAKGPYRRYILDFSANPGVIDFSATPDGNYTYTIDYVTLVYDRDGMPINRAGRTVRAMLTRARYLAILHTGVPFHQEISVPAKGEFYLRTAVHDLASGLVGAVEVPVAAVAGLTPHARTER